ncbi:t-SNARE [Panaeolus papilionaceus]|nr:t-SNARE [Panaeolus papilionaceus]
MSVDPYHAVQQEIQSSLQTAAQLQSSFLRIRSMAQTDSEELMWARNELKATLAALEADLEDLEESVNIVESTDARMFGLDDAEVANRRRYVSHVRKEIESMRAQVNSPSSDPTSSTVGAAGPGSPFSERYGDYTNGKKDDDEQALWAREEQQMMIREQEQTMDSIAGTLSTLQQQASLMGQEIVEHTEMLTDLEAQVDRSDAKLQTGYRKLKKFLRDTEEKGSGWCVIILIIVLMALLLAVILV